MSLREQYRKWLPVLIGSSLVYFKSLWNKPIAFCFKSLLSSPRNLNCICSGIITELFLYVLQMTGHDKGLTAKQVVLSLIADGGWTGFYRGLGPRFFSMSVWGTSMVLSYEYLSESFCFFIFPLIASSLVPHDTFFSYIHLWSDFFLLDLWINLH